MLKKVRPGCNIDAVDPVILLDLKIVGGAFGSVQDPRIKLNEVPWGVYATE